MSAANASGSVAIDIRIFMFELIFTVQSQCQHRRTAISITYSRTRPNRGHPRHVRVCSPPHPVAKPKRAFVLRGSSCPQCALINIQNQLNLTNKNTLSSIGASGEQSTCTLAVAHRLYISAVSQAHTSTADVCRPFLACSGRFIRCLT